MLRVLITLFAVCSWHVQVFAFEVTGATIKGAITSLSNGEISCVDLIQGHLDRIEAYDKAGPYLNSIISIAPLEALFEKAKSYDKIYHTTGKLYGSMHCIPIVAKDCYDHPQFPTTVASVVLKSCYPKYTSPVIANLEAEGAIIIAKTNLPDFTVGNSTFMSSISTLLGATKNAYVEERSPYGSSGGTGAAIAASLGMIGLAADTQGSIQLPSAAEGMVGIRPTQGLVSAENEFPLVMAQDSNGPISRTVADAASILELIVNETVIRENDGNSDYTSYLDADGLRGRRIGFSRDAFASFTVGDMEVEPDLEVVAAVETALGNMAAAGATVKDTNVSRPLSLYLNLNRKEVGDCGSSWNQYGISRYLEHNYADNCPIKNIQDIIDSGVYPAGDITRSWLDAMVNYTLPPDEDPACTKYEEVTTTARELVLDILARNEVDFVVYPVMNRLPTSITPDSSDPVINLITYISASTRLPSVTFPVGYAADGVPISMSITGRQYSEGELIRIVYGFEQQVFNAMRRLPVDYPPL